jgi:hypothetical protein
VGGLLYEMLAGRAPCEGEDAMDVLRKKATEDPPTLGSLRPGLPRDIERMVMRALARLPRDRHPSMSAFKEAVLACLAGIGGTATPTPPPVVHLTEMRPVSTARVRRGRIARGAVAATLAGATLAAVGCICMSTARAGRRAARGGLRWIVARTRGGRRTCFRRGSAGARAGAGGCGAGGDHAVARAGRRGSAPPRRRQQACGGPLRRDGAGAARAPALRRMGEPDGEPIVKATAAMREPPREVEVPAIARGQAAFDRGDYPEAVRRGREAIAAGAALGGRLLIGDAYYRLERFADALREYQAALALDPANASIRRRRDLAERAASPH